MLNAYSSLISKLWVSNKALSKPIVCNVLKSKHSAFGFKHSAFSFQHSSHFSNKKRNYPSLLLFYIYIS